MLEEIRIRDLGVIDDAVLEPAAGLTVVTGETGAGKTMVVQGLLLLLGGRADVGQVRLGAQRALVEGRWRVEPDGPVAARARAAGAELDGDTLLVSRSVTADGRSRAHLGGVAVPATLLAEVGAELVAVHGQGEQQRLRRAGAQRDALDRYAGAPVHDPLGRYRTAYRRWRAVEETVATILDGARERVAEADRLRFGLDKITEAAPVAGEDVQLATEVRRLGHAESLRRAATAAHDLLLGEPAAADGVDAAGLLGAARRLVDAEADHDPTLAELAERLAAVGYLLADVGADLASYAAGVEADPTGLAAAQDRQAVLGRLVRAYGPDLAGVLAWAVAAGARLAELDTSDDQLVGLYAEREALLATLAREAAAVSAARSGAAQRLATAVTAELAELAMPGARLTVEVSTAAGPDPADPAGSAAYGPDGLDGVELLLAAHPGAPSRPLSRAASGGELSRVMLGLEVVLGAADPVPTFVFDEVDAGVGGRAAVELGRRLARLAHTAQVIVVTHLPQVAAFADRHLLVVKSAAGAVTRSDVHALDDGGRVRELSRMLAGQAESALARGHAEELLTSAAAAKADRRAAG